MNLWDKKKYLLCYGYENEGEGQEGENKHFENKMMIQKKYHA